MITWKNYDEYMMMHADGELKPAEEQELMSFLFEHPELQHELAAFSMSKLIPDTTLVYTHKEDLLQPLPPKKFILFTGWQRYAVAAGIAAVVFFSAIKFMDNSVEESTPYVAANAPHAAVIPPAPTPHTDNAKPQAIEQQQAVKQIAMVNEPKARAHRSVAPSTQQNNLPGKTPAAVAAVASVATMEPIERLQTAAIRKFDNVKKIPEAFVTNIPTEAIYNQEGEDEVNDRFTIRVPIDELKRKGIENVNTALASGVDKINDLKQEIAGTSISLRVEKRRLIVSF